MYLPHRNVHLKMVKMVNCTYTWPQKIKIKKKVQEFSNQIHHEGIEFVIQSQRQTSVESLVDQKLRKKNDFNSEMY